MKPPLFSQVRWMCILLFVVIQSFVYGQTEKKVVYITRTGAKYHRSTCQYLRYSRIEVAYEEAFRNGYQACLVCRPGTGTVKANTVAQGNNSKTAPVQTEEEQPEETEQVQTSAVQCSAITQKGTRCKRMTSDASGYCWQHNK